MGLFEAVRELWVRPYDEGEYEAQLNALYKAYTTKELARMARTYRIA